MYTKTITFFCAGNKVFVKFQAQGGVLTPAPPPCVRPWWSFTIKRKNYKLWHTFSFHYIFTKCNVGKLSSYL